MRAILYARVSSDDESKTEGLNLEGQLRDGHEYCARKGYQVIAELSEDARGASGADYDLPGLAQALEMAARGEYDVFVCREVDRLARDPGKMYLVKRELERAKVVIEYTKYEFPNTPWGRYMEGQFALFAQLERDFITERMVRGRKQKVRAGHVVAHKIPFGYRVGHDNGKTSLVIEEREAQTVFLIFTSYVQGLTMGEICRQLEGTPTPGDIKGYRKTQKPGVWYTPTISLILSSETYTGLWCYAGDESLTVEVPAIVTPELYQAAQERKAQNKVLSGRNVKYQYLLRGRVVCADCGCKMSGRSRKGRGKTYLYYVCRSSELWGKDCQQSTSFRSDQVDGVVWRWVCDTLLNPETLAERLEAEREKREKANKPLRARLEIVKELIAENQAKLDRLLDLYLEGDLDKEMLTERKVRLEALIRALKRERGDLVMRVETRLLDFKEIATIKRFAREMRERLDRAGYSFEQRRQIVSELGVEATLAIEGGQKLIYVTSLVDERTLPIDLFNNSTTIRTKSIRPVPEG